MAKPEVTKKIKLVGIWQEDVFTDELVKTIAAVATAEKGKKMQVKLNKLGLRLKRPRLFQENEVISYHIDLVKTVTKNPHLSTCVMFILSDPDKKYKIIALRCASDVDAADITNVFGQMKKGVQYGDVELRKRDNGNWTLRERSAHNASRHLAEIFKESQPNGEVNMKPNGDATDHVPVLDRSRTSNNGSGRTTGAYIKRSTATNNNSSSTANHNYKPIPHSIIRTDENGDDYVIETEVSPYPYNASKNKSNKEIAAVRDELDSLSNEMHEIKSMLEHTSVNKQPDHIIYPASKTRLYSGQSALPSRPVVYTAHTSSQPVVYRAPPKTYEARMVSTSAGYYTNPWASHHRLSGDFRLPARVDQQMRSGDESGRSSLRVKFDAESIRSNTSRRSRSSRVKSEYSIPTTIERSIETTYARPVVIRRDGTMQVIGRRPRPASYHVMSANELHLYRTGERYDDVAL